jgi:hypothetical protein
MTMTMSNTTITQEYLDFQVQKLKALVRFMEADIKHLESGCTWRDDEEGSVDEVAGRHLLVR